MGPAHLLDGSFFFRGRNHVLVSLVSSPSSAILALSLQENHQAQNWQIFCFISGVSQNPQMEEKGWQLFRCY